MAMVRQQLGDSRSVIDLLLPNAVRSRGSDLDVMAALEKAGKDLGMLPRIETEVDLVEIVGAQLRLPGRHIEARELDPFLGGRTRHDRVSAHRKASRDSFSSLR